MLTDTPGDDAPVDIWILMKASPKIIAMPVVSWVRKKWDMPTKDTDKMVLEAKTITTPDQTIVSFVRLGTTLYIFQLNPGDTALHQDFGVGLDGVESYTVRPNGGQLEIEITHTEEYCKGCKDVYGWSTSEAKLDTNPQEAEDQARQQEAEAALLARWQPDEAIPLLKKILENPDDYQAPYFMYLLGLAYEVKGDENSAVQAYWELWTKYPESSYARLAQAKLELRK
ncbi:MAG: hypothetical protein WA821_00050 [Anaerolineales bacterium]